MAVTRFNDVRDALAERINSKWIPAADALVNGLADGETARESLDDEVVTRTLWRIDSATHRGRKVYLFRDKLATAPATRGGDRNDYWFSLLVAERYDVPGDPQTAAEAEAWIDARVAWCEWLLDLVGDVRGERLLATDDDPSSGLWPEVAEITAVCDVEEMTERKLFLASLSVMWREIP